MKKFLLLLSLIFASVTVFAQKSLNYQAVIMDPKPIEIPGTTITGQPLKNGKVSVRFALISKAGVDYEEVHETMTDEFGLINLTIGGGNVNTSGIASNATSIAYKTFQSIKWDSNLKQLKVSLSFDAGKNFTTVSNQPFNYSAYALYAEAVEYKNVIDAPTVVSFFTNDAGYINNNDLDPVKAEIVRNKEENIAKFLIINQSLTADEIQIAQNTNDIQDLKNNLGVVSSTVSSQVQKITDLTNQGNSLVGSVNGLTGTVNGLTGTVNSLSGTVSNTQARVNTIENSYENRGNKSNNVMTDRLSTEKYPSVKAMKDYVDESVLGKAQQATVDAKEDKINKSTNVITDQSSDEKYPSVKAIKSYVDASVLGVAQQATVDAKEDKSNKSNNISGDRQSEAKYPSVKAITDYIDATTLGKVYLDELNRKANIDSPTFTGTPSMPAGSVAVTKPLSTNGDNSIATTAYVQNSVREGAPDASTTSKGKLQLTGDLGGTADVPKVIGIQGTPVSAVAPENGQIMKLVNGVWVPTAYDAIIEEKQRLELTNNTLKITGTNSTVELPQVPNATDQVFGTIKLAGDLTGTAAAPIVKGLTDKAPLASPALTGTPTAPTADKGTNTEQLATTRFVISTVADATPDATNTIKGKIQLAGDLAGSNDAGAPIITNQAISTEKIKDAAVTTGKLGVASVTNEKLADDAVSTTKILNASVTTGKIADGAITNNKIGETVAVTKGGTGATSFSNTYITKGDGTTLSSVAAIPVGDVTGAAPLASPALSGIPTAPTAAKGTNTTQLATTQFVISTVADATPDATNLIKGKVQLGGDLAGSNDAAAPKLTDGAVIEVKIASGAVTTTKIADENVTTAKIADANVTTAKIADANVTTEKIADANVTTIKIADANVTTAKIADASVITSKIANGNVTTEKIADANVTSIKIADGAITNNKIGETVAVTKGGTGATSFANTYITKGDGTSLSSTNKIPVADVTDAETIANKATDFTVKDNTKYPTTQAVTDFVTTKIAEGAPDATTSVKGIVQLAGDLTGTAELPRVASSAIDASKLASDAVTTIKILDANVTTAKIADANVTTSKILDANVTTDKIADANVTTAKLADASVLTAKIADLNITTAKIADLNVTTAKIADQNVTTGKIADLGVTAAKIAANTITAGQIANETITATQLAANAVSTVKIADGAITNAKIGETVSVAKGGTGATSFTNTYITKGDGLILSSTNTIPVSDVTGAAPLLSPALTGVPTAPTAIAGTKTDQLATTDFVTSAITVATPDASNTVKGIIQLAGDLGGSNEAGAPKLTDAAVVEAKIAPSAVTTSKIADANVTTAKLADASVLTAKIADLNVTTGKIADLNVTTAKLADQGVTTDKIADANITTIKIASGNVTTDKIADANITTIKIASGNVTTDKIADANITTIKIADQNVTTGKIADLGVTAAKIAANTITAGQIANNTITAGQIANETITATQLAANAVSTVKIADGAITNAKIGETVSVAKGGTGATSFTNTYITKGDGLILSSTNTIPVSDVTGAAPLLSPALTGVPTAPTAIAGTKTDQLATTDFVTSAITVATPDASNTVKGKIQLAGDLGGSNDAGAPKLTDGAVVETKIAANAVTTAKIANSNVTSAKIADLNVTTAKIADLNVTTGKIADLNVTTAKLADQGVTGAKIANATITSTQIAANAVTATQLATNAVTAAKIASNAVTSAKIQSNAVTSAKIASNAVTTVKISDANVTTAKLADGAVTELKLANNAVSTAKIADAAITNAKIGEIISVANGGTGVKETLPNLVFAGSADPAAGATPPTFRSLTLDDLPSDLMTTTSVAASINPHYIYGYLFDGTADLDQIISSNFGGTGNGFTKFAGPTTSEKTFTLPDADATILTTNAAVTVEQGGTGLSSLPANAVILGNGTSPVQSVAPGSNGNILTSNGTTWVSQAAPTLGGLGGVASNTAIVAATKTKITYDEKGLVTAGTDAGITDIVGLTDALAAKQSNANLTTTTNFTAQKDAEDKYPSNKAVSDFVASSVSSGTASNVTGIVLGANGGTGIANTNKTITLGGNLVTSGAFNTTLTATDNTIVTLPVSGTLATLAGTETLTNKSLISPAITTPTGILKSDVGLSNVDNTSDALKPLSNASVAALALKADLASPSFTGTPVAPTAEITTNTTQIATTQFVQGLVSAANATNANLIGDVTSNGNTTTYNNIVPVAKGGTGASTKEGAQSNLGLVVGSDVLAYRTFGTAADKNTTDFVAVNTPITGGTNTKITYDDKGLVTGATAAAVADITGLQDALDLKQTNANLTTTAGFVAGKDLETKYPSNKAVSDFVASSISNGTASNVTGIVLGKNGGTGIANTDKTITLGGNLITSGAFETTIRSNAQTDVTLPASGTLATLAGTETLTNKTIITPQGLVKSDVGLSNVDNTSDALKPLSTASVNALALKADLASPSFSGTPVAPTASIATNSAQIATTAFVQGLVSSANATNANLTGDITSVGNLTTYSGVVPVEKGGTGSTSLSGILKGNGTSSVISAIAGTDYQAPISVTTNGSGAATFNNNTINIPTYSLSGLGGVASNSAITGATKTKITYDSKGLVTLGEDAAISDITGLQGELNLKQLNANMTPTAIFDAQKDSEVKYPTNKAVNDFVTNAITNGSAANVTGIVLGKNGGTGIDNTGKTITLGGSLTTSGAYPTTLNAQAATNVTLPISGTIATLAGIETLTNKTIVAPKGIVKADVGLGNVDNTSDANKPVSTATQTALDLKQDKANLTLTAGFASDKESEDKYPSNKAVNDFVTNAISSGSAANVTGIVLGANGGTGIDNTGKTITLGGDLVTTGNFTTTLRAQGLTDLVLPATGTLATLAGTETLTNKTITSPVITAPTGIVKADVGLGLVDNTSDINKPISTATQSALDLKQNISNLTTTADFTAAKDLDTKYPSNKAVKDFVNSSISGGSAANVTGIVLGANGGTGVANTGKTITIGGNLTTTGDFPTTLNAQASTNLTLPTTGTLATLDGVETLTNKSLTSPYITNPTGIVKANVGLGSVDNTSDLAKPISTLTQAALNLKQDKANLTLAADFTTDKLSEIKYPSNKAVNDFVNSAISGGNAANVTGVVLGANGGTGVANTGKTITLAGNLETAGGFNTVLTTSAATNVTLPASGTLATLAGTETFTNKTLTSPVINTPTGIVKADVGLSNVDNTSDALKPLSNAAVAALALKATIASPSFTGTPVAPTAATSTNTTQIATTAFVQSLVSSANATNANLSGDVSSVGNVTTYNNIVPIEKGGTNAANIVDARINLGLKIGQDVLAYRTFGSAANNATTDFVAVNTPIIAGTNTKITYDAKGLVTSATSAAVADITGLQTALDTKQTNANLTNSIGFEAAKDLDTKYPSNKAVTDYVANAISGGNAANVTGVVLGKNGGTGVNNLDKTITLGGNLVTSGAFNTTLTAEANTNVTLPATGKLATLAGSETLTNKTIVTPLGIVKSDVGLSNVDNTSDALKPLSNAAVAALALKATIASPSFTGTPVAPTAAAETNSTQIATTEFVKTVVSAANATNANLSGDVSSVGNVTTYNNIVPIEKGGTNAANIVDARINLGLKIGQDVLAYRTFGSAANNATTDFVAVNTPIIAGTNTKITYDAKGLVTSATSAAVADITGLQTALDTKQTNANLTNSIGFEAAKDVDTKYPSNKAVTDYVANAISGGNAANVTGVVLGKNGGTGVNNLDKTITLGGNLVTSGAFNTTLTAEANTNVTLPSTGKLATLAGVETFTNKTLTSPVINAPTGIVKADVGLSNVDNTSDALKPLSIASVSALALKADLVSPSFTGTPVAPTAAAETNSTQIATTAFVKSVVSAANATNADLSGDVTSVGNVTTYNKIVPIEKGGTNAANIVDARINLGLKIGQDVLAYRTFGSAANNATSDFVAVNSPIIAGANTKITYDAKGLVTSATSAAVADITGLQDALDAKQTNANLTNSLGFDAAKNVDTKYPSNKAVTDYVANAISGGNALNVSGIVLGKNGGTGWDNTDKTIKLGGNLVTTGAFETTLNATNTTNVTLPLTGTLATLAGSETLSNKTLVSPNLGTPSAVTLTNATDLPLTSGVLGVLPVANGGIGTATTSANLVFAGPTSGGNAAPGFRKLTAADLPTDLGSGNITGSAASITTARSIYGNLFDGTADLNQVINPQYGGTGSAYTKFTGPTAERTFTLPDNNATIATLAGTETFTNKTLTSPVINTPTGIVKSDVGLSNVDNTSDALKPLSEAAISALALKSTIESPSFTGTPVAPTAVSSTNTTQIATTAFVQSLVSSANATNANLSGDVSSVGNVTTYNNIVPIAKGGTNAATASEARTNLGLEIGTNVLAYRTFGSAANSASTDFVAINSPITAGTNTKITYDAKGLVTSASAAAVADITGLQDALDAKQTNANLTTTAGFAADKNLDTKYPSNKAVKDYVTTAISAGNALNVTGVVQGENGGTGVANIGKTITIGGNLITTGEFPTTLNVQAATNLTLPTTGTLATLAGAETFTNKTLTSPVINTPTGIVKADVGLSNVDNTSDALKPVSIETQTALDLKANSASPTFTGTPVAPTAASETNSTQIATTAFVKTIVSAANATNANLSGDVSSVGNVTTYNNIVPIAKGGTNAATASEARTNLGLAIGTDVLAYRTFGSAANSAVTDFVAKNNAISGGTNTKITYDAKGLVTSATSAAVADITGLQDALDAKQTNANLTNSLGFAADKDVDTKYPSNKAVTDYVANAISGGNALNVTGVVQGVNGGTGLSNPGKTIKLAGNLETAGGFNTVLTTSAVTNVILPASGTLATLAGSETLTNKTIVTPLGIVKSDVGLSNVDNTSDALKPLSEAAISALALKSTIESPSFTGTPVAPTAASETNSTQIATTAFVKTIVSAANATNANLSGDVSSVGNVTTYNNIVPIAKGGTGAATKEAAQSNLGLAIGTDVLAYRTFGSAANSAVTDFVAKNNAITAGTNTKITYDAKGLVTSATSAAVADITGLQDALDAKQTNANLTNSLGFATDKDVDTKYPSNKAVTDYVANAISGGNAANVTGVVLGKNGGTGVNNLDKTITLGGNLVTSGAFNTTIRSQATTDVTLPASGTLATLAGAETLTNKTILTPQGIVKGDVGLGLVNNTSDLAKPISTLTQGALDLKQDKANLTISGDFTANKTSETLYPSNKAVNDFVSSAISGGNALNVTGVVQGVNGGTGLSNPGKTIKLAGNLETAGGFTTTLTTQANSDVTLPTSGTLATLAGTETLSNKTLIAPNLGTPSTAILSNATGLPLTTGVIGTLAVTNGGTGATTLSGMLKGNGTGAISTATDGTDYQAPISITTDGSSGAATFAGNVLNIPQYSLSSLGGIGLSGLSASAPLTYNNTTGHFAIPASTTLADGYLSKEDFAVFNNKQSTLTFSTGLTNAGGTVSVNTSQNISTLSNLNTNGIVTTSGSNGTLSVTSTLPVATGGTGATSISGLVKGNGSSAMSAAIAGTDYQAPITLTTTGTGDATFVGNTLNIPTYSIGGLGGVASNTAITGATNTKITYDSKGLVTGSEAATTADIAASADKNYVTDAEKTKLLNTSGTNTGDQTINLTGAVTGSGTGTFATTLSTNVVGSSNIADGAIATPDLANKSVSFEKIQDIASGKLVGSISASAAAPGEITLGSGLSLSAGTLTATGSGGTVTNVSALTLGTTGTDISSSVSNATSTPVITLNIPTASAANRGALSAADWTTFNAKQGALSLTHTGTESTLVGNVLNIPNYSLSGLGGIGLTSLSAVAPLSYDNASGQFTIAPASASANGYLSSSDWSLFNAKQAALTFSTGLTNTNGTVTVNPSQSISNLSNLTSNGIVTTTSGTGALSVLSTLPVSNGGTGATSFANKYITRGDGTTLSSVAAIPVADVTGAQTTANLTPSTSFTGTELTSEDKYPSNKAVASYVASALSGGNALNVTGVVSPANGGTGINNGSNTITLGGALSTVGAFATTLNATATTNVTLPTAGTLATLAGTETMSNKTLVSPNLGTPSAVTLSNANGLPLSTGVTGTLPVANGGTGATTLSGILKGNGTGAVTSAAAGVDYQAPISLTTDGTTGAATLVGNVINVPQYSIGSLGGVAGNNAITAGTNTKITYDSKGLVTGGSAATTADIAASADKNYVTDAEKTLLGITTGTNTGDETSSTIMTKLGITTLSGSNTGDETTATIKTKLGISTLSGSNTGDQTISLSGAISGSGTGNITTTLATNAVGSTNITDGAVATADLADASVSYAKMQNVTAGKLLGSTSASAAAPGEITIGTGLTLSAGTLSVSSSSSGVSSISGGTTGLTPNTASTGAVTLGGTLNVANGGTGIASYTAGDILYATGTTSLAKLAKGGSGDVLTIDGTTGLPVWGNSNNTLNFSSNLYQNEDMTLSASDVYNSGFIVMTSYKEVKLPTPANFKTYLGSNIKVGDIVSILIVPQVSSPAGGRITINYKKNSNDTFIYIYPVLQSVTYTAGSFNAGTPYKPASGANPEVAGVSPSYTAPSLVTTYANAPPRNVYIRFTDTNGNFDVY